MPESIRVHGQVQGVGFRPFVWRLARSLGIRGRIWNDGDSVCIQAWGNASILQDFRRQILDNPPPLARIDDLEYSRVAGTDMPDCFVIANSRLGAGMAITPDAAICPSCTTDVLNPDSRYYRYPFTSCTHCGPRLSIIYSIPYDREYTSMSDFPMCPACQAEYEDPSNRRFHAQTMACPNCGPSIWLEDAEGRRNNGNDAIAETARLIRQGYIVAIKGIGGFHLAVDATNEEAVSRLRARKQRDSKPFAMMVSGVDAIGNYAELDSVEQQLFMGQVAPIVLLASRAGGAKLAQVVAPGQDRLGFMLPYTPLHALLMKDMDRPIVLTSGNRSHEPQCIGNEEARCHLAGIADHFLLHDRKIVSRLDDSVVAVTAGRPRVLRRARGYAPAPLPLPPGFERTPPLLAMGGDLKHTFCLLTGGQGVLSQHMGDLEYSDAYDECRQSLGLYRAMFGFQPQAVAIDMHPDYLSGRLGRDQAELGNAALITVQHHHAHIAACMAEHGCELGAPPVLGIALDGLGYGLDGTLWGGEFLEVTYEGFKRLACFRPVPMLGGSKAVREPWRNTFVHLHALGWERVNEDFSDIEFLHFLASKPIAIMHTMMERKLNCPQSSSCGRLFDAVAAVLGICREQASYEGEAAIRLEALAHRCRGDHGVYPVRTLAGGDGLVHLCWAEMWPALLTDIRHGEDRATIAARFHKTVIDAVNETAIGLCRDRQLDTVALGGGAFQNQLLLAGVIDGLRKSGLNVHVPEKIPVNDGGLSFGQAVVAGARMLMGG